MEQHKSETTLASTISNYLKIWKKKSHFFDRFLYSDIRFTIITYRSKWRDTFLNRKFLACNFTSVNAITLRVRVALIIDSMFHEGSREPPRQRGQFPS